MATKLANFLVGTVLAATPITKPPLTNQLNSSQNAQHSIQRKVSIADATKQKRTNSTSQNK